MSLEVIYVVRHGYRSSFTVDPATGIYSSSIRSPTGIPTDPPLTSYGVEQASELADHLLRFEPPIDLVYSSPYYRCLQTIDPFVAKHNESISVLKDSNVSKSKQHKIRVEKGISEWFGFAPWEHPVPAPLSKLQELFPNIDAHHPSQVTPPINGETPPQLHDRVASALDTIITQCDQEGAKSVIICSHAASIIAMGRVLTGRMPINIDEEDFAAFTCGLSTYRRRKGAEHRQPSATTTSVSSPEWRNGVGVGGGWTCVADSDCSFLKGGPERGWRFSGDESFGDGSFDAVSTQNLSGSGAGLGADIQAQESDGKKATERPTTDVSKL